uniref:Secreted protein n=1 Tax=Leishmania guyanensis TaxID=5670 RepID=A0A1E1IWF8_LEIGU|nr:Hypothetical protein BN36_2231050 [Leishmania guyanensis]CCM15619.1 Hypothetical protein BN36_2231270 [Leishmania guyanensis]
MSRLFLFDSLVFCSLVLTSACTTAPLLTTQAHPRATDTHRERERDSYTETYRPKDIHTYTRTSTDTQRVAK